jgi:hypothetical protein
VQNDDILEQFSSSLLFTLKLKKKNSEQDSIHDPTSKRKSKLRINFEGVAEIAVPVQPQAQHPQPRECAAVCPPAPHKGEALGQPDRANVGLHDPAKDTDHIGSIGAAPQLSPDGWHTL